MGITVSVVDHQKVFSKLPFEPVIVNNWDTSTLDGREGLKNLLRVTYDTDTIDPIPTCKCGKLHGKPNKVAGVICDNCGGEVEDHLTEDLHSILWVEAPEGIHGLINPVVWMRLRKLFSIGNNCIISWFANAGYRFDDTRVDYDAALQTSGFSRGWNNFCENYLDIIKWLFANDFGHRSGSKAMRQAKNEQEFEFLKRNKKVTFTKYIPIPNKIIFVGEKKPSSVYSDPSTARCLDAINTITSIKENQEKGTSFTFIERKVWKFHMQISDYHSEVIKDQIGRKEGAARKHIYGSRAEFSARAVITSFYEPHEHFCGRLPWGLSVGLLRIHITSKLEHRGYSPREVDSIITRAVRTWCPIVREIFNELIAESFSVGIPILLLRNPTLDRLSGQLLDIIEIKDDVDDNTIDMSVKILAGPNKTVFLQVETPVVVH